MTRNTTLLSEEQYPAHNRPVALFSGDEKPEGNYVQIAFIEITGHEFSSNDELMEALKAEAQQIGADAVMGAKRIWKRRERGFPLDGLIGEESEVQKYDAPVMTGVAIKYR